MKNFKIVILFITSFLLLSCASTLPPSQPSSKVVDQADTILLEVNQDPDEAYTSFANHLSNNGFGFENTDKNIRVMKTDMKEGRKKSVIQLQFECFSNGD